MPVSTVDIGWAAGFLEGEGSFGTWKGSIRVRAGQQQRQPIDRLLDLFGGTVYLSKTPTGEDFYNWNLGSHAAAGVMMTLYGQMSPKRKREISDALRDWLPRPIQHALKTHCIRGHALSADNLYTHDGNRHCKRCRAFSEQTPEWREARRSYRKQWWKNRKLRIQEA